MKKLINDRLIRALNREPVDCTPVWIMRQAGRYLPEYRAVRKKAGDFMVLCKTPQLACEVALQPLERFDLDAAILFSDILTIPDAMGLGLYFESGEGPKFKKKIKTRLDFESLEIIDVEKDLGYVMKAVALIAYELRSKVPLIGFSGSPWTLACYMVEGGSSKDFNGVKKMAYEDPRLMHDLLDRLTVIIAAYLIAQVKSGVQVLQVFDSWGGLLSSESYSVYSLDYIKKVISLVRAAGCSVPIILFTKGGGLWLETMLDSGADCIGLDWTIDIAHAKRIVSGRVSLQGNLDPCVLYGSKDDIRKEVIRISSAFSGSHPGHVFNLGHGILPDIDPFKVAFLVESIHELTLVG